MKRGAELELLITLTKVERMVLGELAYEDLRSPVDELRFLIRQEGISRGLWPKHLLPHREQEQQPIDIPPNQG